MGTMFYDAFGKEYEMEILSKKEVEEIISNLDWSEIIKKAWNNYVDGWGVRVELNTATGEIAYSLFQTGTGDIQNAHWITLYEVEPNILSNEPFNYENDILLPEEYEECERLIENMEAEDIEEAMEKLDIDFNERFGEYLVGCFENGGEQEIMREIKIQIDEIYKEA